jgi:hypothetical protein
VNPTHSPGARRAPRRSTVPRPAPVGRTTGLVVALTTLTARTPRGLRIRARLDLLKPDLTSSDPARRQSAWTQLRSVLTTTTESRTGRAPD